MSEKHPTHHQGRGNPALLILIAAVFAAAGAFSASHWLRPVAPALIAAKLYPQPRPIADFSLTDSGGGQFNRARWSGDWDLVFFGFTNCPDVCPNTLNDLKAIDAALRAAGHHPPRVTFISVDPERDTALQLNRYVAYFNPKFQSATGAHEQLHALTRQLGVIYQIAPHEPGAPAYEVDHSASLLLIDPEARLRAIFPAPHQVTDIVTDLATLMDGAVL